MQQPIRVAQVVGKMVGGGVESVVMNYYRHINHDEVQFDFLVDADSTLIPRQEIEALGGRVFVIPPYQHQIAYQKELVRLFKKEQWKIVHSHINTLSVFPLWAAKRAGVPIRIAHSHATAGKGEFVRNAMKYILRCGSTWFPTNRVACSEYAGKWLFNKAQFTIIPNAFEIQSFAFNPVLRQKMRRSLGIEKDAIVIGHVGRFAPPKNQMSLISFFAHTKFPKDKKTYLVFAGQGPDLDTSKRLAKQLHMENRVIFAGQQSNMPAFYSALDVFVLPSTYEGLGLALIEAQASGLPCIASSTISHEADPTHTVHYVEFGNETAWEYALSHFRPNTTRVLNQSKKRALETFDIKKAAPRLVAYYERLVAEHPDTRKRGGQIDA
jgi:glycosyltransferase involved in cell wall biosynthesis